MTEPSSETLHASCVAIEGRAVLITGRSGAGKSDLALRLIDRGALLVSDDYTLIQRRAGCLSASAPERIAGRIEVRGLGILSHPFIANVPVAGLVSGSDPVIRLPDPQRHRICGVDLPCIALALLEPSAPIKVEHFLRRIPV